VIDVVAFCQWCHHAHRARTVLTPLVHGVCDYACVQEGQLYSHKISHIKGRMGSPLIRSV